MPSKSSSPLHTLSSNQDAGGFVPRQGQQDLITHLKTNLLATTATVKLPGGYGKSIAIAMAYGFKRQAGHCNRLLIVVANDNQREQILHDFKSDCKNIGIQITDVWKFDREANTVRAHKEGKAEIFVITIQQVSSTNKSEIDTLMQLIRSDGQWMVAADEYHHYATERDWGIALQRIVDASVFVLALSATPDRDGNPTIFGEPQVSVLYRTGIREKVLKRMRVATYHYAVDLITADGQVLRYTTDELRSEAEAEAVKDIDTFEERRQIRYSPKYVHPLIIHPVTRLLVAKTATGKRLQMLIRAMSCRHAQAVAEQVRGLFGDLVVEWVGTGPNGRPDDENRRICKEFCPPKEPGNISRPTPKIDVLVQVGMAGEGFDSVFVAEIIDLSLTRMNGTANQAKQFVLRGSRWIPNVDEEYQVCHVNVPSDHPLIGLLDGPEIDASRVEGGEPLVSITDWLDGAAQIEDLVAQRNGAGADQRPQELDWRDEIRPFDPDALRKFVCEQTRHIEFTHVSLDDEHFATWVDKMKKVAPSFGTRMWDMNNEAEFAQAVQAYKLVAASVADAGSEQMKLHGWRSQIDTAVGRLALIILRAKQAIDSTIERSQIGDLKKLINGKLRQEFGPRERLLPDELLLMYNKIVEWDNSIRAGDIPSWAR